MKLFGNPGSLCTRKVLTTLYEKGAPFELTVIDLATGQRRSPENLARQPFGQIPTIEEGDFRLFESRPIIRYLDATRPGPSLTPSDPKGRALMEQWISVETSNFTPHAMGILYQLFFGPMQGHPTDAAKVEDGRKRSRPRSPSSTSSSRAARTYSASSSPWPIFAICRTCNTSPRRTRAT